MNWTCAIEQLRSEGHFGEILLWHNGSVSIDGAALTYADLEVLEDSMLTDVKPSEEVLIAAYARWEIAEEARSIEAQKRILDLGESEILAHIDSNVNDFASAKALIKEMAQELLKLRSQVSG